MIEASACISHSAGREPEHIVCPALIVGGERDIIVEGEAAKVLTGGIKGSETALEKATGSGIIHRSITTCVKYPKKFPLE